MITTEIAAYVSAYVSTLQVKPPKNSTFITPESHDDRPENAKGSFVHDDGDLS